MVYMRHEFSVRLTLVERKCGDWVNVCRSV